MMDALWSEWWVWLVAGLLFAILEVLLPGYIFLGFALGAATMGGLVFLGLGGLSIFWMLVAFAAFSLVAFILLRRIFKLHGTQVKIWDKDIND